MDFTGITSFKTFYTVDDSGIMTLTFKTEDEATTIGTLTIEANKFRSFSEIMTELGRLLSPNGAERVEHSTEINVELGLITTEFE